MPVAGDETLFTLILKVAEFDPALTTTFAGIVNGALLDFPSVTLCPPLGATRLNETVPTACDPLVTEAGLSERDAIATGSGVTVMTTLFVDEFNEAEIVTFCVVFTVFVLIENDAEVPFARIPTTFGSVMTPDGVALSCTV